MNFYCFQSFSSFAICWLAVKVNDNFLSLFFAIQVIFLAVWIAFRFHVEFNRKFIVPGASKGKTALAISNELPKVADFFHRKMQNALLPLVPCTANLDVALEKLRFSIFNCQVVNFSWTWFEDDFYFVLESTNELRCKDTSSWTSVLWKLSVQPYRVAAKKSELISINPLSVEFIGCWDNLVLRTVLRFKFD